ncbi:FAD:protein FMN transferase [Peredibacter starrii]|uniref:FAD:protein FMN transferase n=1 Tax=Peredibacter starrii TaxID=28202 RepID=UPI00389AA49D
MKREVLEKDLNIFFEEFNQEFSTYRNNSVISTFNRIPVNTKFLVSPRFIEMLKLARKFHDETGGAFDPTLGPLIKAWGFGGGSKGKEPDQATINKIMADIGFKYLHWDETKLQVWKTKNVNLDINAFAPGWAADLIGEFFENRGVQNYMVDISGEILFKGTKPQGENWVAGIERPSPQHAEAVQMAFKIKDQAIATSGNYRQFYDHNGERRSHIIDPKTGRPVHHSIASASVLASTAAAADAWGTAMMVLGKEGIEIAEKRGYKVYLLEAHSKTYAEFMSNGMQAYLEAYRL